MTKEEILEKHLKEAGEIFGLEPHIEEAIYAAMDEYAQGYTRKKNDKRDKAIELKEKGHGASYIAKELGVSRQMVYNYLKEDVKFRNLDPQPAEVVERLIGSVYSEQIEDSTETKKSRAKLEPKGKGKRVDRNIYKYENCYTYERMVPGKDTVVMPFSTKQEAIKFRDNIK